MADRADHPPRQPWRTMLAASWPAETARRSELLDGADRRATASWARHVLARADAAASGRIHARGDDARWELVAAAAQTLEACAAVWQAFGPAAGARRPHLVRRLERLLTEHEQSVLAVEAGCGVDRRCVHEPARLADEAIGQLLEGVGDLAAALDVLEHASLSLAAAAIRAVQNIDATGCADGRAGRGQAPDPAALRVRFGEIRAHADTLTDRRHVRDVATWLSECLVITTPEIPAAPPARGPDARRAEPYPGASDLRRRWLRLGARELLIARGIPRSPSAHPSPCADATVCDQAAGILADGGLTSRADAFDAARAWSRQAAALSALVPACARALGGDAEACRRVDDILADRLARIVSVLWLIDHRSAPAPGTTSP